MAERRSHRKGTLASDAVASAKILSRWVERFKAEARAGTIHRSSRPRVMPGMTDPAFAERLVGGRAGYGLKEIAAAEPVRRHKRVRIAPTQFAPSWWIFPRLKGILVR